MKKLNILILSVLINCAFAQNAPSYIKDVYDNIFRSMANGVVIKPKLILVNDLKLPPKERVSASYSPSDKTISIGKSFIELTRKFGADSSNARAHVLSHELAHLFLNHGYANIVGTGFASTVINKELKRTREKLEDQLGESAADQCAFFYAYISGYSTNEIVPRLLDSIYKNYQLTDKMLSQYPPLKERKNYAKQASVKMQAMNESFDFANICLAHGKYEMAEAIYKTIIDEGFKSREIVSNLGASYMLQAIIAKMDTSEKKYVLPVQLDFNSRLEQSNNRGILSNEEITEMLNQATFNFKLSTDMDPKYAVGYLNLSISSWLLGQTKASEFYLEECKEHGNNDLLNKIELFTSLKKIMSKDPQQIESGKNTLEELAKKGYALAKLNLGIYNGEKPVAINQSKVLSFVNSLENKKLSEDFTAANNILDSTFTRDVGKLLKCHEIKGKNVSRKWKYSYGTEYPIVYQYIFEEQLKLNDFNKDDELFLNSKRAFETGTMKIFIFEKVVIIDRKGKQTYQILKSNKK